MNTIVTKTEHLAGSLRVPGDKSIAHRALILGALARSEQIVEDLPASQDVVSTARCLRRLGVGITERSPGSLRISPGERFEDKYGAGGIGPSHARSAPIALDAGNSGTTTRLLAGLIAGARLDCIIDGDESLRRRPMSRIIEPLAKMGASLEAGPLGGLPLRVRGAPLSGITYSLPVASAQVKSAVLIAGLFAEGETTVIEPSPTRDHTEIMLATMGCNLQRDHLAVTVSGGRTQLEGVHLHVPGDLSSAAFFMAAAAMLPRSEVLLLETGVNSTRTGFVEALQAMGAEVTLEPRAAASGEPLADIRVRGGALKGIEVAGDLVVRLIDELPLLAVVATRAEGDTVIREASELRHKESDRISAIVNNLALLGADVDELDDGLVVHGPCVLTGAAVPSHGDHRIAMAMAVAGLTAAGRTQILQSEVAGVSYPGFFRDLQLLAGEHCVETVA